jgi:hypothetical protein
LAPVLLDDMHDLHRCPRVQEFVSYCRLGKCARDAAGKRDGPFGKNIGTAHLTWAFSEAAVLLLRPQPAGQRPLASLENTQG